MTPSDINTLFQTFSLFSLLLACIPILITLALIIAIFQINSRVAKLTRLQEYTIAQLQQMAELQRQALIAQLATAGPNHKTYLDYLIDQFQLNQDQAEFILKQSGQAPIDMPPKIEDAT